MVRRMASSKSKKEETLRPPLAPSEKNNASLLQQKSRTREIQSRRKSGIAPLTIPSTTFASPQRSPSQNVGKTALSPSPAPPKRSQSAERRHPKTLKPRVSPPCSPSRTLSSKASTPVHDVTGEVLRLSSRKQASGRTANSLWPSMRSLSASFLSVSTTKACREDPKRIDSTKARATSRSFDFSNGTGTTVFKLNRALSSPSGEMKKAVMEHEVLGPSRTLSVPAGGLFCASPSSSSRRKPSTAGIQSSLISYFTGFRKGKERAGHVEDAHQLRILENRYLQWRFLNARADAAMTSQRKAAKMGLSNAWEATSEVRGSVTDKSVLIEQVARKSRAVFSIKHQMKYLEEWVILGKKHSKSLAETTNALESCTLRLPITDGAKADIYATKNAFLSAIDVMQSINSSLRPLFSKLESTMSMSYELVSTSQRERLMLDDCRNLLALVGDMQMKQMSLRAHLIQHRKYHLYAAKSTLSCLTF